MNDTRRDTLRKLRSLIKEAHTLLEEVRDDEENALAAMPESFQDSVQGWKMEDAIGSMDEALNSLESAIDYVEEAAA